MAMNQTKWLSNSTLGWRCCCQSYRSRQHGKAMVCYLVTCPSVSEKLAKLTLLITCCYKCGLVSPISWPTRLGNFDFTGASCWVIAFCQTRYDLHQFAILDDAGLVSLSQQFLSCLLMAVRRCSSASATRETWAQGGASGFFPFFPKYQLAWALLAQCWWENCSKPFSGQWSNKFWPLWVTHAPFDMCTKQSVWPAVDPPLALSVRLCYRCRANGSRELTSLRSATW